MPLPPGDPRRTRQWRTLATRVVREEPTCWLRLPGCTLLSTTADHVIPVSIRPDLALIRSNCHGACLECNSRRQAHPVAVARARAKVNRPPALGWFD